MGRVMAEVKPRPPQTGTAAESLARARPETALTRFPGLGVPDLRQIRGGICAFPYARVWSWRPMSTDDLQKASGVFWRGGVPFRTGMASKLGCALALMAALTGAARAANVTVNGAQTYQVIEGFGVNANHRSWTNNELQPVLDALIDQAGMTLFRVIYDNADWEATNENSDPNVMNWITTTRCTAPPDFQKLWGIIGVSEPEGDYQRVDVQFPGDRPGLDGGTVAHSRL